MRSSWRLVPLVFVLLILVSIAVLTPDWRLVPVREVYLRWSLALLWAAAGIWGYRWLERTAISRLRGSVRVGAEVGLLAGGVLVALVVISLLGVSPGGIAVGSAVTGIVLGLAAQPTLGNLFGGFMLMALRPYVPGDRVTVRSGQFGGSEYTGVVRDLTFFYTVLTDGPRLVYVPNSVTIVSALTVHARATRTVTVTLPPGCDLDAARERLAVAAPEADLSVVRWSEDGAELSLEVPTLMPWQPIDAWLRECVRGGEGKQTEG